MLTDSDFMSIPVAHLPVLRALIDRLGIHAIGSAGAMEDSRGRRSRQGTPGNKWLHSGPVASAPSVRRTCSPAGPYRRLPGLGG